MRAPVVACRAVGGPVVACVAVFFLLFMVARRLDWSLCWTGGQTGVELPPKPGALNARGHGSMRCCSPRGLALALPP